MVRAFYQTVIQPCKKADKNRQKLLLCRRRKKNVWILQALPLTHKHKNKNENKFYSGVRLFANVANRFALQTTVIDLEELKRSFKTTHKDNKERKNTTEILPFYLRKK